MAGAVLHWDFENAPVPRGVSVSFVLGAMREVIHTRFGALLSCYVYADTASLASQRRHELAAYGLDLVDCSREAGKANTVDFRIISRALAELARPATAQTRSAVVVVTGDGDFSYSIATLRNLAVPTMLIFDADRRSTVNETMLQVAEHTVPISFRGQDYDDAISVATTVQDDASVCDNERAFLQALDGSPMADDDGFRAGTFVGDLFHRLRGAPEKQKSQRKAVYRSVVARLVQNGTITKRVSPNGGVYLRRAA